MDTNTSTLEFSLLRPQDGAPPAGVNRWGENTMEDLDLEQLAWDLSIDNKYHDPIQRILLELCSDIDTITYRQEILEDFLKFPALAAGLRDLLPTFAKLKRYAETGSQKIPLQETLSRLTELNTYITTVRTLQHLLGEAGAGTASRGLARLRSLLEEASQDPTFLSLEKGLPDLLAKLNTVPSITIGINLNSELIPVEATLLAIHDKPFKGGTYFDLLLGRKTSKKPNHGVGPLHDVPHKHVGGLDSRIVKLEDRYDPMLVPLFKDLYDILRMVLIPIATELRQYAQVNATFLIQLEVEIAFYLGAADLVRRMESEGLPMCRPQAQPMEERTCFAKGVYNLVLALRLLGEETGRAKGAIVPSDVEFSSEGRIFILTGPNQGGKTIYTQAVGQLQALFQAGLYVPAESARMSPVDGMYTHFATLERTDSGMGRLAEEARRLNDIFQRVTDKSLVLLNESLSSTSPGESLYLARDIVHALKLFGVRAIFATHLHELAENLEATNAEVTGDSRVVSLVAGVTLNGDETEASEESAVSTFEIKKAPPRGLSYAKGIAIRHGISFEQLKDHWLERQADGKKK